MLKFDVRMDIVSLRRALRDIDEKQVRFATAVALTRTAKDAQQEVIREMKRKFSQPTRFTLNATYIKPATKQHLVAEVGIKDESFKAVAPIKWLRPQIYGGSRMPKRFEQLLQAQGILPSGWYAMPGAGARMDASGNMSRGQIGQILSALGAARDTQQRATARSRKRNKRVMRYFAVSRTGSHLRPGVYERIGGSIKPVLSFTAKRPRYRVRLPFDRIVQGVVSSKFGLNFKRAALMASRTAWIAVPQAA